MSLKKYTYILSIFKITIFIIKIISLLLFQKTKAAFNKKAAFRQKQDSKVNPKIQSRLSGSLTHSRLALK